MKKTIVLGILVFIGLVLSIYGFVVLPDNVVVQVGASGKPSNVYPKLMVIGLDGLLMIGGALGYFFVDKKEIFKPFYNRHLSIHNYLAIQSPISIENHYNLLYYIDKR